MFLSHSCFLVSVILRVKQCSTPSWGTKPQGQALNLRPAVKRAHRKIVSKRDTDLKRSYLYLTRGHDKDVPVYWTCGGTHRKDSRDLIWLIGLDNRPDLLSRRLKICHSCRVSQHMPETSRPSKEVSARQRSKYSFCFAIAGGLETGLRLFDMQALPLNRLRLSTRIRLQLRRFFKMMMMTTTALTS